MGRDGSGVVAIATGGWYPPRPPACHSEAGRRDLGRVSLLNGPSWDSSPWSSGSAGLGRRASPCLSVSPAAHPHHFCGSRASLGRVWEPQVFFILPAPPRARPPSFLSCLLLPQHLCSFLSPFPCFLAEGGESPGPRGRRYHGPGPWSTWCGPQEEVLGVRGRPRGRWARLDGPPSQHSLSPWVVAVCVHAQVPHRSADLLRTGCLV